MRQPVSSRLSSERLVVLLVSSLLSLLLVVVVAVVEVKGMMRLETITGLKFIISSCSCSNLSIRAFRARISQLELFELILLLKLDKQFPVEQFEATVSQSTVPSPPLISGHVHGFGQVFAVACSCKRGG